MKLKPVSGIMLTLLLTGMLALAFNISQAYTQSETVLYVDPSNTQVSVHSSFTVNVTVADVVDLSGFGFHLGYNTTVLDILTVLIQPPFESPIIELNETEGYVCVIASLPPSYPEISGTFVLTSIAFGAAFTGNSTLNLHDTILIGYEIEPMPHTTIDGSVTVYAPKLLLETNKSEYALGEEVEITFTNYSNGTVIFAADPPILIISFDGTSVFPAMVLPVVIEVPSNQSLTWTWDQRDCIGDLVPSYGQVPPGIYIAVLVVDGGNSTEPTILGTVFTIVMLILGDLNGDGIVDIVDVVTCALAFGSKPGDPNWNPVADLNNDGIIDIVDLVIIGIDFGKRL